MLQQAKSSESSQNGDADLIHAAVKNISPTQAWNMLQTKKALLVDVRTEQELPDAGRPDLTETGGESVLISWRLAPSFEANPHFIEELQQSAKSFETLIFMCKAGGRSYEATQLAQELGYSDCYNVEGGMDGETGWKASNLPWGGVK